MRWYIRVWSNSFNFKGRSSRKEFWMFVLIQAILALVLGFIEGYTGLGLSNYYLLFHFPLISLVVRRLHDANYSGWFYLIGLIPMVGGMILISLLTYKSFPGDNKYGSVTNL